MCPQNAFLSWYIHKQNLWADVSLERRRSDPLTSLNLKVWSCHHVLAACGYLTPTCSLEGLGECSSVSCLCVLSAFELRGPSCSRSVNGRHGLVPPLIRRLRNRWGSVLCFRVVTRFSKRRPGTHRPASLTLSLLSCQHCQFSAAQICGLKLVMCL